MSRVPPAGRGLAVDFYQGSRSGTRPVWAETLQEICLKCAHCNSKTSLG